MSIRKVIIPNPPFQYLSPYLFILNNHLRVLVILSLSSTVYFGDTREYPFKIPYCIYSDNINDQTIGDS